LKLIPGMDNKSTRNKYLIVDFDQPLLFTFDGKTYAGYQGDTVASALYRAGVRIFSRSFKYHRPRGLMTLDGNSPNDMLTVDGVPNVHASTTALQANMQVRGQNAWPSVRFDLMNIFDTASALLPVGFYYKTFIRPRVLWPFYEKILRNAAGLGKIEPNPKTFEEPYFDKAYAHAEVTVVGSGPAGMAAALAAAQQGAQVVLVEKEPVLGGHLRSSDFGFQIEDWDILLGLNLTDIKSSFDLAEQLRQSIKTHPNITLFTSATAFGWYEGNFIGVNQGNRLVKLRTNQLIVATGGFEQPLVFENNDLPGIFLGGGLQRLMNLYGIKPGQSAVVVTTDYRGWYVARELLDHDVEVSMLADTRPEISENQITSQVREAGISIETGITIKKALGRNGVRGAVLSQIDGNGQFLTVDCDIISISGGYSANNGLLYQSGCKIEYDPECDDFVPQVYSPNVLGAGGAIGTHGVEASLLEGQAAGLEAATRVGYKDTQRNLVDAKRRLEEIKNKVRLEEHEHPSPIYTGENKAFICFCEDVAPKDVRAALGQVFDDIQTLKRYTTISMGPSQGKICGKNTIKLVAQLSEQGITETGTTTSRPPFTPVKLGVLAGRRLDPIRLTPIHHIHTQLGATMMNAGQWKRPEHYSDPEAEVRAVRQSVGIIDVSTLGKIDVRGPDSVELLERIYTGKFAGLKPNRLRYGLMCTEEGIIFDDGVVACLSENHYFLTTTSGGAGSVYEWLTWWATAWGLEVHITGQTATYAAVNLAGPRARDLLSGLTELDVSNKAFPYMHMRQGTVAGVPVRMMRIGFVGELGYEIHVPAEYGAHLWNTIMETGADFGIRPFGVEAQRVLRLDKGHIIVGQDTDALSDPYGAGMGWAVKLDKPDFVGKPSLVRRIQKILSEQLVGFEMSDPSVLPLEGEQFVRDGHLVGRVTSARYSPTLEKSIGLGWVNSEFATIGSKLTLRTNGQLAQATAIKVPFYDPKGIQLRN
jgi:sarcosine oxidase subunit alpha